MYLKALELQGFKSFPEKVRLEFERNITAIVGPNGSGKSNISDAIAWVMGEQRTKALRGGKMEDVVFGGTEMRQKMGFAQVSLILDNSERFFDIDSTELMITRRYYRSGESEYYINRESVRLKDITELLMDTGLGRYGYSIIGQGKISEIVSAKSGDRRELFEEAAGISRFRYRKDESERKLTHTEENLVRINDKIDELELQVGPLREQAETAKKFLILRDELRLLEVSVWLETLEKLSERARTIQADCDRSRGDIERGKRELEELYAASESLSERMREKDIEAESFREALSGNESAAAELESELAVLMNNERHNLERQEQLRAELDEQRTRSKALESQINQRNERIAEIRAELEELDGKVGELAAQMDKNAAGGDSIKQEINSLFHEKTLRQTRESGCRTVIAMLGDTAAEQEQARLRHLVTVKEAEDRQEELSAKLAEDEKARAAALEKAASISNVIEGYKLRIDGREKKAGTLRARSTALTIDLNSLDSRIKMLSEMEKEFEGYSKAVKTVMRESSRGVLGGIHGPVANLVKADERFALAIETALGASMQSIVVDTQEQGKSAIELLKRQDAGRATFLPISTIRPSEIKRSPDKEEGYLGTAFELAGFDKTYENIFSSLLARTFVAESLSDAVRMSRAHDNQLRIVTLDGQMINPGGSMTGGSAAKNTGILSRANELKKLRERRLALSADADNCDRELKEAERELAGAKYELQAAEFEQKEAEEHVRNCLSELEQSKFLLSEAKKSVFDLKAELEEADKRRRENEGKADAAREELVRIENELTEIDKKLEALTQTSRENEEAGKAIGEKQAEIMEKRSSLTSELSTTESAIEHLMELFSDLSGDGTLRRGTLQELETRRDELSSRKEGVRERLAGLKARSEAIRAELSEIISQKLELEGKRVKTEKLSHEKNNELLDLQRTGAAIEQKKLSAEMEEKQILDKLWDSYSLSRTAAQAMRQPLESMPAATRRISVLKRDITALGNPNLGAIDEFERVNSRYSFLTEQRDDVEKSKRELEKIIADITGEMKDIFRREFDLINESFRNTFHKLFGGGRAALVLEDSEDILNCGIEINVQPPGKTLTTLSLLSGGETAFVAIALYFAILEVRPSPFCVMDEIEAALDEANVVRFAQYMRSITDKTQFIVITHRRGTMEESDMLYGVTMQEKGISQIISVDLHEAERSLSDK